MAVRKTKAGLALKRWFKEDWKDQRTGKACGRQKGEKRVLLIADHLKEYPAKLLRLDQRCQLLKKENE